MTMYLMSFRKFEKNCEQSFGDAKGYWKEKN